MRWQTTGVVALALAAGVLGADAAAADDHVPADAKICRKHDEKGTKKGETVHLGGGRHRYNGGDGNDRIYGGPKDDIINGGRGNDVVHGGDGNDVVCGGLGDDRVDGDEGRDRVYGEEQNDYVTGGAGNDYINGQAGRDRVVGYGKRRGGGVVADGRDFLDGSFDRDVLVAGGFDSLLGGADDDRLSTRTRDEPVKKMDGYIGDDRISGSAAGDRRLLGDIGADVIRGGGGDDRIDGGKSDDDLFGGGGDDLLQGGDNVDALSGGDGEDVCDGGGSNRDTADGTCERVRDVP